MATDLDPQSSELILAKDIIATLREPFLVLDRTFASRSPTPPSIGRSTPRRTRRRAASSTTSATASGTSPRCGRCWRNRSPRRSPSTTSRLSTTSRDRSPEHDPQRPPLPAGGQEPEPHPPGHRGRHRTQAGGFRPKDSELRYRRLFQTAKDGILILDAESGKIIDSNPFMSGLLGYEHDEFLGNELWQIGLFRDKEESRAAYRELRAKGYIRYDHLPLKTKGGREVEVEFVSNIYTVDGQQVAQCNIRDITDRSRLERQTQDQASALADLHRRKDEFLAMLSHELRNPLSPILNAVHLLRLQGDENLIQQEARNVIERQVGQLITPRSMTCWRSPGSPAGRSDSSKIAWTWGASSSVRSSRPAP